MGSWEDEKQFGEMCREGKVWGNWNAGPEVLHEGRGTVWVDLSGDVLEFLDVKKEKVINDEDEDEEKEKEKEEEEEEEEE